ncbi:hypothetical protein QBC40DRAFT_293981 [Triangularia verruculosa]|uniref:Uncharacterized protein n=1 Tax=Triangularia verruculosa TaxID=2587418 RepID=A0AAN7AW05_9PEZI|nr:hypothetical protein QBC40DRAFT_293981 [Triangularia verruculosa]
MINRLPPHKQQSVLAKPATAVRRPLMSSRVELGTAKDHRRGHEKSTSFASHEHIKIIINAFSRSDYTTHVIEEHILALEWETIMVLLDDLHACQDQCDDDGCLDDDDDEGCVYKEKSSLAAVAVAKAAVQVMGDILRLIWIGLDIVVRWMRWGRCRRSARLCMRVWGLFFCGAVEESAQGVLGYGDGGQGACREAQVAKDLIDDILRKITDNSFAQEFKASHQEDVDDHTSRHSDPHGSWSVRVLDIHAAFNYNFRHSALYDPSEGVRVNEIANRIRALFSSITSTVYDLDEPSYKTIAEGVEAMFAIISMLVYTEDSFRDPANRIYKRVGENCMKLAAVLHHFKPHELRQFFTEEDNRFKNKLDLLVEKSRYSTYDAKILRDLRAVQALVEDRVK